MYCIIHCTRLMYLSNDILPPVLIKAKVQLDLGFLNRLILHTSTKASIGRKGRRKGIDFLDMVINPPVDVSIGDERNRQNARLMRQVHKATLFVFTHLIILSIAALLHHSSFPTEQLRLQIYLFDLIQCILASWASFIKQTLTYVNSFNICNVVANHKEVLLT